MTNIQSTSLPATRADHWNTVNLHETVQLTPGKKEFQMKQSFFKSEIKLQNSVRRLIGSWIIESAAYCNQKLVAHLYIHKTRRLIESFGYCYHFYAAPKLFY